MRTGAARPPSWSRRNARPSPRPSACRSCAQAGCRARACPSASTSIVSRPPSTRRPNSSSSASARRIVSWIRRCIGRAPMSGSKPFFARSLSQPVGERDLDLLLGELAFELEQELVDDAQDDLLVERLEAHHRVETVAELGREQALDVGHLVARLARVQEADRRLVHRLGAGVRRHDDDDAAEVGLPAVVVGQRAVVHDLEQHVEDVGVRLLDLVEQEHGVRLLRDRLGEQAALVEADVARRRADQPAHRVALHVLAHVEADQVDAEDERELLGDLGLADAGRAAEQERADRLVGPAEAGARHLDRRGERVDRRILAEDDALQVAVERLQLRAVVARHRGGRDARDLGDDLLDLGPIDRLLLLALGQDALRGTGLVDHVDRLVGQVPVVDELGRELGRGLERGGRVLDAVVLLEAALQALQDLDRLLDRRLDDVDLLEPPRQRRVLLEDAAVLGEGGRADALHRARS